MIDTTHAFWMFEKRHPPLSPQAPRSVQARQNMRRAVWRMLVGSADPQGRVTTTMREIAQQLRDVRPSPAWGSMRTAIKNVQLAIKGLQEVGLVKVVGHMDIGDGGHRVTYQLRFDRPKPVNTLPRRAADARVRAFDERAAAWSHERRWRWRAVWKAIVASADDIGYFQGDIPALADAASDRLRADVADQTVAAVLRWSVATSLTELVHGGRPTRYRLLIDRHAERGTHASESSAY